MYKLNIRIKYTVIKTSLQFSPFAPYLSLVNLCNCAIFRAVIFTHFSNKTLIITPHQVCDLRANFQAFQTSSFDTEVYLKEYLRFFSILSAAEWREAKKNFIPHPKLRIEGPGTPQYVFLDAEFPLFESRDSGV